ncbi:MAG: arginyltransferase, partial [Deltaproteobacteria bacterium]|nr:arginyltransferase [Deltaproteobacteria bacterium]
MGYYVKECPSMNYKARFRPHEILDTSYRWVGQ